MNFNDEFAAWLMETSDTRQAILDFIKVPVLDVDKAIQMSANCQHLRDKAEWFLSEHVGQKTLSSKADYPGLSADERKLMVRRAVKDTQYILDGLQTAYNALYKRIINQNVRR